MASTLELLTSNNKNPILVNEAEKDKTSQIISDEVIFQDAIPLSKDKEEVITTDTLITDTKPDASIISDEAIFQDSIQVTEPTTLEKLEYGWDKNQQAFGNILRIGKAKVQDIFDPDKSFQDYVLENEATRKAAFEKEHWKFVDGKHDGIYSNIGEIVSFVTDPYYIAGYYFGSPALASPFSSAVLNAALLGGDTALEGLAKTGKVDWEDTAWSAGIGGAIGLAFPVGAKLIKKYFPNATKKEAEKIVNFIDDKIAKKNNLTKSELTKFRNITNTSTVKKLTSELNTWATNFYGPIAKEFVKINTLQKNLIDERKAINLLNKSLKKQVSQKKYSATKALTIRKDSAKQLIASRAKIKLAKEIYDKNLKTLVEKQGAKLNKYYNLEGKRMAAIMEAINKTDNFAQKALKAVMANLVRPVMGGAMGGGMNVLASPFGIADEDDFWTWVGVGTALGVAQKRIEVSTKLGAVAKNKFTKWIENDATKLTLQYVREKLSATTFTKLKSFGGVTEKIGRLLLRGVDDPIAEKSVISQAEGMQRYFFRKAAEMVKGISQTDQAAAVSIVRGNQILEANSAPHVKKLAVNIKNYLDEFKALYTQSGFVSPKDVDNYFPRLLNWDKIDSNMKAAEAIFAKIYKTTYGLSDDKAAKAAKAYLSGHINGDSSVINAALWRDVVTGSELGVVRKGKSFVFTPLSDHIIHKRTLDGPYQTVEKILEQNGLLVNDVSAVLSKVVNDSVKSISFARKFGKDGELLYPLIKDITKKYENLNLSEAAKRSAVKNESELVMKTINAYFDRHGASGKNQLQSTVAVLAMLSNLNMLGRVTISSLGDIVQPFQHSFNWTSAIRGLWRTNIRAASEKGLARNLNYDITNEMSRSVFKAAGLEGRAATLNTQWMGKFGVKEFIKKAPTTDFWNTLAFKGLGLEWLTGYARRFAYNTGASDAYLLSRTFWKIVNQGKGIESNAAQNILNNLSKYQIKSNQALSIGAAKNFTTAIKNSLNKKILNQAGLIGSNRDALIPQVSNRLLFTQSRTPWIRVLGQFLSWAQAKSAQTNAILKRIENGNAQTLIKTLAVIPVYGGIQMLREIAKYGEVVTDPSYNTKEFISKAGQLSGMWGWLPDSIFNRFVGPGNRDPWFLFAPALTILTAGGKAVQEGLKGDWAKARRTISKRIALFPEWRNWISKMWFGPAVMKDFNIKSTGTKKFKAFQKGGEVNRQRFRVGGDPSIKSGEISKFNWDNLMQESDIGTQSAQASQLDELIDQKEAQKLMTDDLSFKTRLDNEIQKLKQLKNKSIVAAQHGGIIRKKYNIGDEVNKKNIAAAVVAGTIATTGVNADINKAVENNILPAHKPTIEKVVEKNWDKLSELDKNKKEFLIDSASQVYVNNENTDKNVKVPSSVILSIIAEETGWGTSRFAKDGNNYFNMIIDNSDQKFLAAKHRPEHKVRVFENPEESINIFKEWVATKPHYKNVRKTIMAYNDGKATKEDIIDAIADTGYAENVKWADNVKSILHKRVDGKHKKELSQLYNNLFVDK